jgi:hypothetical protein
VALTAAGPTALEATGMEPQLRIIREAAAARKWPVTCEGRAGEEGVIRIEIPPGVPSEQMDAFENSIKLVASSWGSLGVNAKKPTCDREPVRSEGADPPAHILIFGNGEEDPRLVTLARECGYATAYWRAVRAEDYAWFGGTLDKYHAKTALDAGESLNRYGPMTCFRLMSHRARKER